MLLLHFVRRWVSQPSVLLPMAVSASVSAAPPAQSAPPPSIIIIFTDDLGYGDVECYAPGAGMPTPNIDRLAEEGMRFTQFYVAAPICSPSRAGLLTGRFPSRLRLNSYLQRRAGNRNCDQDDFLDAGVPLLARSLRAAGYATAHIGKWHLGGGRDVTNAPSIGRYGFDEWVGTWESPEPHPELGVRFAPWDRRTEPGQVPRAERTGYMVERALDFLRRHRDRPCFVNLWPDDTHTPHRPSPEMMTKHGGSEDEKETPLANFRAVLEEYDGQIGRLLDGLVELGMEDNTIVIFTGDNGPEPHFDHLRTAGLRGMKLSLYEGGIREPFIIRWPGRVPAGTVNETTVLAAVDLFPTLCKLAGADIPGEVSAEFDGEDLSAAFLGGRPARTRKLLWEYGRKPEGYGYPGLAGDRSPNVAIRDGKWKLLVNADGSGCELYDMASDPMETVNLADQETGVVERLLAPALVWRKSLPGRSHESK